MTTTEENKSNFSGTVYGSYLGKKTDVSGHDKLIGYKKVHLGFGSGKVWFISASHQQIVNLKDEAYCTEFSGDEPHLVPHNNCTCGFYSFKKLGEAQAYKVGRVVVEVVCSGRFIEFDKGYRYSKQAVSEIFLPIHCGFHSENSMGEEIKCSNKAVAIRVSNTGLVIFTCGSCKNGINYPFTHSIKELVVAIKRTAKEQNIKVKVSQAGKS